jgi:serine/threonine protein kinase/Tol biopolymer transport system component
MGEAESRSALHWRKVEELYHSALDCPPDERQAFLAQACYNDRSLLDDVASLLAEDGIPAFLDQTAAEAGVDLLDEEPLEPGTRLGPYQIEAVIGSGGMGQVYRALDTRLGRAVALKTSAIQFNGQFEREARAVSALNHPHICHLHDIGPNYLIMELIEGKPLKGPLPLSKAIEYACQILDALDAAHRKGIVHCDLKPANILVTRQGIKLLDFGIAAFGVAGPPGLIGTLPYMAPEQLQGSNPDIRSDLFSFGCIFYEVLTGHHPFRGDSPAEITRAILEREPEAPLLPTAVTQVLERCLAKDPEERFQTARDLRTALIWAKASPGGRTRSRRWLGVAAALLLAATFVVGWMVSRWRQTPSAHRVLRVAIDSPNVSSSPFRPSIQASAMSLSPDGIFVTYRAQVGTQSGFWLQPLDGSAGRLIPGTADANLPFWSPDSKHIGFFIGNVLQKYDLTSGIVSTVCEAAQRGGAWLSDNTIIYGSDVGLFRVSAEGGTPSPLTTVDASLQEYTHGLPVALPGNRFLYSALSRKEENSAVYVSTVANPRERRRLVSTGQNALLANGGDGETYLIWRSGRDLMAEQIDSGTLTLTGEPRPLLEQVPVRNGPILPVFTSGTGLLLYDRSSDASQLNWVDETGARLSSVGDVGEYSDFRIAPDGRRVAAARFSFNRSDIWILDPQRGLADRFTFSGFNRFPVWSPDGTAIVYGSQGGGGLMRQQTTGGAAETVLLRAGQPRDWSRDGRFLLYQRTGAGTKSDLWVVSITPDGRVGEPAPWLHSEFNEDHGRFFPEANPHWVAYQSDQTGRIEIYITSFPRPEKRIQVSTSGGSHPRWRGDGRELFYISGQTLMAVGIRVGRDAIEASMPKPLFTLPAPSASLTSPYDVGKEGRMFLVRQPLESPQPLQLIENWPTLLGNPQTRQ